MNIFNKIIVSGILFSLLFSPLLAFGDDGNISSVLLSHISNSNTFDVFPGFRPIFLPSGVTVHLLMMLLSAVLIISIFMYSKQKSTLQPKGLLVAFESLILFVQDDIVAPVMGKERGEKWLPFFCTLFLFLLTVNFLGLIPAFKTATGNINVTTALAVMILILIFIVGIKSLGIKKFFMNLYPEGIAFPIGIFVAFLEFIGIFIKTSVLSLRLFANMFAGHLAIVSFLALIFILRPLAGIIAVPFSIFTYLLEILVCVIQALVFTMLSCIFMTMASSVHE